MDVLEERTGVESSTRMINLVRERRLDGCISALTVPVLWFLAEKNLSETESKKVISEIIQDFSIIPLDARTLNKAFGSEIDDFEDAIQLYSAINGKCESVITRNKKDFRPNKGISILTPEEFLAKS